METFLTILLDGLQFSSYLFIVSAGLTIIFGVMKILNVCHGSFYAWGAYTAAFFIGKFAKRTSAGIIKNPPPAPTIPVNTPTIKPSIVRIKLLFFFSFIETFSL